MLGERDGGLLGPDLAGCGTLPASIRGYVRAVKGCGYRTDESKSHVFGIVLEGKSTR